ncbi:MAG: phosphatidylglycerol lysyltransferase [Verrucomicrobiales bacterium]|jgi:phosphatidylglycerol lysyltransferase
MAAEIQTTSGRSRSRLHRLLPLAGLLIFSAALWALHREISHFKFVDFRTYLGELSKWKISFAIGATLAGYAALISYDWFALRFVRQKLPTWRVALTAFIGYAFSMNIGQAVLSGGAVRMRLYTGWGIGAGDVTRIIGFCFVIGTIGQLLTGGLLFVFSGVSIPESVPMPFHSVRWLGLALLSVVVVFFVLVCRRREAFQFRNWRVELPKPGLAFPAVVVSGMDWALSGVVLFALMPDVGIGIWQFLAIVMLAHILSVLSMVPGGLGVFETVVIHLLPGDVPKDQALSALIAFRAIYYLIPFLLAIVLLGGHEVMGRKGTARAVSMKVRDWLSPFVPLFMSLTTFAAGTILILSGATPAIGSRLTELEKWLPLPVVELSHFLGSIVGIALLLLSGGLRRRVDAAWFGTVALLAVGIAASLFKGLDYEEAAILAIVLAVLVLCRQRFHRKASLFATRFTTGWWVAVGLVLATVVWVGFAAYERTHYNADLWLHFGIKGDASRFLRATAGIASVLGGVGIWRLLRPGMRTPPSIAGAAELARALPIVQASANTNAYLALLGDKRFLFSQSGNAFLMFGIQGNTWVTMGDPVGDPNDREELIWEFRELCDAAGARPAYYQVQADTAHEYASVGMVLYKLGEEARVDLRAFSLEGSARKNLR